MVRRRITNINNPSLQKALIVQQQLNPNAAIKGMQGQGLYSGFAANDAARELQSNTFAAQHALGQQKLADRKRQHGLTSAMTQKRIDDTKAGSNIGRMFGAVELGLGFMDKQASSVDRKKRAAQNAAMWNNYMRNQSAGGLDNLFNSGLVNYNQIRNLPRFRGDNWNR